MKELLLHEIEHHSQKHQHYAHYYYLQSYGFVCGYHHMLQHPQHIKDVLLIRFLTHSLVLSFMKAAHKLFREWLLISKTLLK